jgi:hypothetical protein
MHKTVKVRCAVIGAGGFAEICHVPGLQSHPQAEAVLLCGRNEARRRAMAARLAVPETAADYRDVVARPDIDVVTITTPNVSHHAIAVAALKAGNHALYSRPFNALPVACTPVLNPCPPTAASNTSQGRSSPSFSEPMCTPPTRPGLPGSPDR